MKENGSLPEWMCETEQYAPAGGRDGFLARSTLRFAGLLAGLRGGTGCREGAGADGTAPARILCTLSLILLAACSRNRLFFLTLLAAFLVRLCFLPGRALAGCFKTAAFAALFSLCLTAPAAFWGATRAVWELPGKVFLSVGLIRLLSVTTPWNRITEGLGRFHVPDLFLLILDITLKYIALLGEICLHMLEALTLRSVGKNDRKAHSLAGVAGVAFLKSRELGEEMYGAMVCRGYDGTYRRPRRPFSVRRDAPYLAAVLAAAAWFVFLEGA